MDTYYVETVLLEFCPHATKRIVPGLILTTGISPTTDQVGRNTPVTMDLSLKTLL